MNLQKNKTLTQNPTLAGTVNVKSDSYGEHLVGVMIMIILITY